MKMLSTMLVLAGLAMAPKWAYAQVYSEVGFGVAGGKTASPMFQMKAVKSNGKHEISFGYFNIYGAEADGMKSAGADLPTIALEFYKTWQLPRSEGSLAFGGGVGYTMPNLASGVHETADNDLSWTVGTNLVRHLSRRCDLEYSVKGFFFRTDSHLTTYGSHLETFQINGVDAGQVEVLDEAHQDNSINFNSVLFNVSLRW